MPEDLILEVVEGAQAGRQVPLRGAVDIGRDPSMQLAVEDTQISRRHARVAPRDGQAVVEDLGSTNGTYVNDQPIQGPRAIGPGDRVRVGLTVLLLRDSRQVAHQPSAVVPAPPFTEVARQVLQPVAPRELAPVAAAGPDAPQPGVEETEPAFFPPEVVNDVDARSAYAAVQRLVDARVKRQTNIAVFALLGGAGLAVVLAFGLQ